MRVVPAAAGGPKGLVLLPLDEEIFGRWLPQAWGEAKEPVHLMGASIGAWRMAAACATDPVFAFRQLADDYINQTYPHPPGRMPTAEVISRIFGEHLERRLQPLAQTILNHPHYRLHVLTSRGQRWLQRPGPKQMWLGWLAAYAANARGRHHLGQWMERVVFSDPRSPLPFGMEDFRTRACALDPSNLCPAVLASCSIPFALQPVHDVPGGPAGTYWDGGITDYHLHLNYAQMSSGLVLYPHFIEHVVPGWLDKAFQRRHGSTAFLDNLVLLSPRPDWVKRLPGGKLPDRKDFKTWGEDEAGRQRLWRAAHAQSLQLAEEFAQLVSFAGGFEAQALP